MTKMVKNRHWFKFQNLLLKATRSMEFNFFAYHTEMFVRWIYEEWKCHPFHSHFFSSFFWASIHNESKKFLSFFSKFSFALDSAFGSSVFEGNFTLTLTDWRDYNNILFLFFILEIILLQYVATFHKSYACMLFPNIFFSPMSLHYQHNIWPIRFFWSRFSDKCQKYNILFLIELRSSLAEPSRIESSLFNYVTRTVNLCSCSF